MREIRTSGSTRGSNGLGNPRPLLSTLLRSVVGIMEFSNHREHRGHGGCALAQCALCALWWDIMEFSNHRDHRGQGGGVLAQCALVRQAKPDFSIDMKSYQHDK